MKKNRLIRVNELLRREIGTTLFRVIRETECDLSGVTVTHVITSRDLKTARVLVSVRDPAARPGVINLLEKHRAQLQHAIAREVALKYTPRLSFVLDTSLEQGDRILAILSEMEASNEEGRHDHGVPERSS